MTKVYSELRLNDKCIWHSEEYVKIPEIQMTCCTKHNAKKTSDNQTCWIDPHTEIEVIE